MREGFYSHLPMWPLIEKLNTYFNARFNERPHEEGYWGCNGASKNCVDKTWPIPSNRHFGTFFLIYTVYHMTNDGHLPTSCFPRNLWILDKQAWNRLLEKYTVRMWDKQQIYWSASNEWGCLRISANVATKIWSR